eukprot:gene2097-5151_t
MDGSTQLRGILENIMYLRVSNFLIVSDTGESCKLTSIQYRKIIGGIDIGISQLTKKPSEHGSPTPPHAITPWYSPNKLSGSECSGIIFVATIAVCAAFVWESVLSELDIPRLTKNLVAISLISSCRDPYNYDNVVSNAAASVLTATTNISSFLQVAVRLIDSSSHSMSFESA